MWSHPIGPAPFLEDSAFIPVCISDFFIKDKISPLYDFYLDPHFHSFHWSMCLFCGNSMLFYYYSPVASFEIGDNYTSSYFIIQEDFSYPGFLCFHRRLKFPFLFCEKSFTNFGCCNFDGDCITSVGFSRMAIFALLIYSSMSMGNLYIF